MEKADPISSLVISMREGESIDILDGLVRVIFKSIGRNGRQAQVVIRAPREVKIKRNKAITREPEATDKDSTRTERLGN